MNICESQSQLSWRMLATPEIILRETACLLRSSFGRLPVHGRCNHTLAPNYKATYYNMTSVEYPVGGEDEAALGREPASERHPALSRRVCPSSFRL